METIEVEKSTKERLIRLGGASSPDETIRCLLEQSNRLARFVEARKLLYEAIEELKKL
ncbi:unnamed protein product [marine sediment metagenome]|uniref:Uncharacterized protein n=1 Tax=marine sediment metagenome TaxID=412755 RepID=X1QMD0_9ZZZZ